MGYDSRIDTLLHIDQVRGLVLGAAADLIHRAHVHDRSKLSSPEREAFDKATPKLRETTYGSPEYEKAAEAMGPALAHHYAQNDHHPQWFEQGIAGMGLLPMVEMLCDWIAAGRRHDPPTDIHKSIEQNAERFGYGEEIRRLLHNTVDELLAHEDRIA